MAKKLPQIKFDKHKKARATKKIKKKWEKIVKRGEKLTAKKWQSVPRLTVREIVAERKSSTENALLLP